MTWWHALVIAAAVSVLIYLAFIGWLVLAGRRTDARALCPPSSPVAGQLDDAIIVALVLRTVLRSAGADLLPEHWPGPATSLDALARLA